MSRGEAVLAIDAGTSSVRAARFDLAGRRAARSLVQRPYALHTDRSGKAVRAVGVSCYWHSLLGVDERGRALTPIYTWADARCREDAAALRAGLDEREVHAETGCMLRASFWPAKLRWLRRTEPALFRRVAKWISPAEWLQWRATGTLSCAIGMATGTGLFDPTAQRWSPRLLDLCGIGESKLPPVSDEPVAWGGVQWYPGIGDGAASNLGCGATAPGLAAINIGTSAALRVMREGRAVKPPFGLFGYRVDAKRFLVGGAVSNAGNLHAWCVRELKLPRDLSEVEAELSSRKTPEHGLTVLPFWTAERAPRWNEDDTGSIFGLRQSTTATDILQAITEGFYYRLAAIAEELASGREGGPKWIVSGGGMKSRAALARLANVLGQPVHANPEPEASLRGAAVLAIERLGAKPAAPRLGQPVAPDPEISERYRAARAEQLRMEKLVSP